MKKCIVIGGGFAGLTSAAYLSNKGIKVTLLESSPKLGGRAYSFADQNSQDIIDNGQHILMGCYKDTINFLELIGAVGNFSYQKKMEIIFLGESNKQVKLKGVSTLYPVNLILALLNFTVITIKEKLSVLLFLMKLPFISHRKIINKNVDEWLKDEKQSRNVVESLWEIICVGTLNTNIEKASAFMFREILIKIFLNGNFASTIILPKYGLSESYVKNAREFILTNGGEIKLSSPVESIVEKENIIAEIKAGGKTYSDIDFVISAIPFYVLNKIYPAQFSVEEDKFEYSSILNIHLWLKNNPLEEHFYGLLKSPVHWIFNKRSRINLVISDADDLMENTAEEIYKMCIRELKKYTEITEKDILYYKVLKEKRATFIPSSKINFVRPSYKTKVKNLYLAGDWTDTGLPSTIESAVKSGRIAAEQITG